MKSGPPSRRPPYGGGRLTSSWKSRSMQIGRASGRERVEISGGAGSLKKKKIKHQEHVVVVHKQLRDISYNITRTKGLNLSAYIVSCKMRYRFLYHDFLTPMRCHGFVIHD